MTPSQRNAWISVTSLVALFLATTLLAPYWSALLRTPTGASVDGDASETPSTDATPTPTAARLFFASNDRPGFLIEERSIPFSADLSRQVLLVVEELLQGPTGDLRPTVPKDAKVLDAFVTPRGIAIVNLSKEAAVGGRGTDGELLAVYSVVNSVLSSFPSLKRVQILVESSPTLTLGGHVDLSRPLAADMGLLAPAAAAAAAPSVAPTGEP